MMVDIGLQRKVQIKAILIILMLLFRNYLINGLKKIAVNIFGDMFKVVGLIIIIIAYGTNSPYFAMIITILTFLK